MHITFDDYLKIDAEHWTGLRQMRRSGKHYMHRRLHPREDTPTLIKGRAGHTALLEADRFLLDYAEYRGKTRRGKEWDACVAANSGKTILKTAEYLTALAIRDAVRAHPKASALFQGGKPEESITWTDAETGLPCKARIDYLREDALVDFKTTGDVSAYRFASTAARLGHYGQVAFYLRGARSLGIDPAVKIVATEDKAPHDVAVFSVHQDDLTRADAQISNLLRQVAECRNLNAWNGQYPEEVRLEAPTWAFETHLFEDDDFDLSELGLEDSREVV